MVQRQGAGRAGGLAVRMRVMVMPLMPLRVVVGAAVASVGNMPMLVVRVAVVRLEVVFTHVEAAVLTHVVAAVHIAAGVKRSTHVRNFTIYDHPISEDLKASSPGAWSCRRPRCGCAARCREAKSSLCQHYAAHHHLLPASCGSQLQQASWLAQGLEQHWKISFANGMLRLWLPRVLR